MANQLKMADVQAILALSRRGWSDRKIARELGVHRETVGGYVRRAASVGSKPANALTGSAGVNQCELANAPPGSDAVHDSKPASGLHNALTGCDAEHVPKPGGVSINAPAGSVIDAAMADGVIAPVAGSKPANALTGFLPAFSDGSADAGPSRARGPVSNALPWREVIIAKLEAGLSAQRIFQDLCSSEHGYTGSYHSIRRLVGKLTSAQEPPVRRMECPPGQEAQVDFGRGAPVIGADGKRRGTWVLRIVLSHSRKGYSEAVYRQSTDDFLRCLENAFAHFGGVPQTLVIDNLKAAVKSADWFDPELCPKVRSFAEHYGIAILPTRPYTPRHKGKVENGVKYVKENALKGKTFTSLAEENRHLLEWEESVADLRIHGTTRKQVKRLFEEVEKPALLALPPDRFGLFNEAQRTVHRDGHIVINGAHYSVPPEYLGDTLWARWDGRTVRLFDRRMQPVALHAQKPPGAFSTHAAHLHPHKISGIEKGAVWMLGQVDRIGPHARAWAESMLSSRGIEGMRVLMGLLSLAGKHPRRQVDEACRVAAGHGAHRLRALRQLIQCQENQQPPAEQQTFAFVQAHPIIRGLDEYARFVREAINPGVAASVSILSTSSIQSSSSSQQGNDSSQESSQESSL